MSKNILTGSITINFTTKCGKRTLEKLHEDNFHSGLVRMLSNCGKVIELDICQFLVEEIYSEDDMEYLEEELF